jgi:hypothetical protein
MEGMSLGRGRGLGLLGVLGKGRGRAGHSSMFAKIDTTYATNNNRVSIFIFKFNSKGIINI